MTVLKVAEVAKEVTVGSGGWEGWTAFIPAIQEVAGSKPGNLYIDPSFNTQRLLIFLSCLSKNNFGQHICFFHGLEMLIESL